jgi:hypothetical protein
MLLEQTSRLPDGPDWQLELKLDGYRALAFKKERSGCDRETTKTLKPARGDSEGLAKPSG